MFQFLIGILKTQCKHRVSFPPAWVSIPYRYSKNGTFYAESIEGEGEFQFLIGILKTRFDFAFSWKK